MAQYLNQILQLVENNPGQMSVAEYSYITEAIAPRAPSKILIFGVGKDSGLWMSVNQNGQTVFLEDYRDWLNSVRKNHPEIEAYLVEYGTQRKHWQSLLSEYKQGIDRLSIELPDSIMQTNWDFIAIDAPAGDTDERPGRMKSIYMGAKLASRGPTDVFVHDCDREVEAIYSDYFLHRENLVCQVDRLRHYKIGSGVFQMAN